MKSVQIDTKQNEKIKRFWLIAFFIFDNRRKQNEAARTTLKSLVGKLSEKLGKKLPPSMTANSDADAKSKSNTNYIDPMLAQLKQTDVIILHCCPPITQDRFNK